MSHTNTWCVNAFRSLHGSNLGETRVCCMYRRQEDNSKYKFGHATIQQIFEQPEIQQLRKDFNMGIRSPGCIRCWEEEDAGRESKRIRDNKLDRPGGLSYMELNLGNVCNLKCRTCGPHASSQWIKEAYDTKYSTVEWATYSKEVKKFSNSYDDDSPFWKDLELHLPTIKQFDFYGGEPFLSKKMWDILQTAVDLGYAKDMEIHYATNGTLWPKETEVWEHFKRVSVSFSIDGIDKQFEYMRYPAVWTEVVDNMNKAVDASWCVTLSNLNIYYLDTIIEEHSKYNMGLYLNLVHAPEHFNISNMPDDIKKEVLDKLNSIPKSYTHVWTQLPGVIGFIENGIPNDYHWSKFLEEIRTHDNYRQQNYAETFPEFASLIGYIK